MLLNRRLLLRRAQVVWVKFAERHPLFHHRKLFDISDFQETMAGMQTLLHSGKRTYPAIVSGNMLSRRKGAGSFEVVCFSAGVGAACAAENNVP